MGGCPPGRLLRRRRGRLPARVGRPLQRLRQAVVVSPQAGAPAPSARVPTVLRPPKRMVADARADPQDRLAAGETPLPRVEGLRPARAVESRSPLLPRSARVRTASTMSG